MSNSSTDSDHTRAKALVDEIRLLLESAGSPHEPLVRAVVEAFDAGDRQATFRACNDFLKQTDDARRSEDEAALEEIDRLRERSLSIARTPTADEKTSKAGREALERLREYDALERSYEVTPVERLRMLCKRLADTVRPLADAG